MNVHCNARGIGRLLAGLLTLSFVTSVAAAPSGTPIRIGSTLALTGPLAQTALLHKMAGEIYVEELNRANGLLGRPVEWIVLDDQSKPDLARSLYEKLITVDKVDLVMGPYATSAILAAMGVAQRYQKMLIHNSFGMPHLAKYEMHFSVNPFGLEPNKTVPATVFDALAATSSPPKTVAIVTSKFPSTQFISAGAREVATQRGLKVVLFLEYEFGTRDYGPIAARIKDANPDFLWVGSLGLDSNQLLEAMKKIEYTPARHFHLFPAPGPVASPPTGSWRSPPRSSRSTRRSPPTRSGAPDPALPRARTRPGSRTSGSTRRRPTSSRPGRCWRPR